MVTAAIAALAFLLVMHGANRAFASNLVPPVFVPLALVASRATGTPAGFRPGGYPVPGT